MEKLVSPHEFLLEMTVRVKLDGNEAVADRLNEIAPQAADLPQAALDASIMYLASVYRGDLVQEILGYCRRHSQSNLLVKIINSMCSAGKYDEADAIYTLFAGSKEEVEALLVRSYPEKAAEPDKGLASTLDRFFSAIEKGAVRE